MGEQEVVINQDKPEGTPQRLLDISQIKRPGGMENKHCFKRRHRKRL